MNKISRDIEEMPPNHGYKHILVLLCVVSNFLVALPLQSTGTQHITDVFQRGSLAYCGPPCHIICDLDPAFISFLMEAFLNISASGMLTVTVTNHILLLAEHGIKSLSTLLVKHLSEVWSWSNCLPYAMLCYNSFIKHLI